VKVPLLVATDHEPPPLPKWTRWIRFEQVAPEENRLREYGITISQNLLGEWVVSSSWGRIGGRQQVKAAYFASKSEAMAQAEREAIRRLLRGYQVSAFE
jgi:predicted DNA-binding WGR domain protein